MLGNDTVGDCALAGQAHADMLWAANAEHRAARHHHRAWCCAPTRPSPATIPHDDGPGGNPTDRGTVLLDALKYWRKRGIDRQTIKAFVEVDPTLGRATPSSPSTCSAASTWASSCPTPCCPRARASCRPGRWCPTAAGATRPTRTTATASIYAAYDATGPTVVTWGTTVKASWEFHAAYCDELYAMLSPAWLRHDPPGIDVATLTADLDLVARR